MARLDYDRCFARAVDWGAAAATEIGIQAAGDGAGLHMNIPIAGAAQAIVYWNELDKGSHSPPSSNRLSLKARLQ